MYMFITFYNHSKLVPCPNVGQASHQSRPSPLPTFLFFLYCDKFSSFCHLKSRLLTTDHAQRCHNLCFRFKNDILEKFLFTNSTHARSGEMRRQLYYGHPKFRQIRLPTNAAKNADFLNYIGQQIC